jgi:CRP-like cAMP-binding protein
MSVKYQAIKDEIFRKWKDDNLFLGISRYTLENYVGLDYKRYIVRRIIANLRKQGIIKLHKKRYFVDLLKYKELT